MNSFGFTNGINLPTYVSPDGRELNSCIDHVWENTRCASESFVLAPNLSDHYFVATVFNKNIKNGKTKIRFRDFSANNKNFFISMLEQEVLTFERPTGGIDCYTEYFLNFFHKLLNKYFPFKTKYISDSRASSPWLNEDIIFCINKKHRWFNLFKRKEITEASYKGYCRALRNLLRIAESSFHEGKFMSLGSDQKSNWKSLNSLLNI